MKKNIYALLILIFMVQGCSLYLTNSMISQKYPQLSHRYPNSPFEAQSKIILLDSPQIGFNDISKLSRNDKNELVLQLYSFARMVGKITIKENIICFNNDCQSKFLASKKIFGSTGYGALFEEIILGKDIFEGRGLRYKNGALIQEITRDGQKIYYERGTNYIYFENKAKRIRLKIEDLESNNF